MSGRHKFSDLEAGMAPERRARIDHLAEQLADQIDHANSAPDAVCEMLLRVLKEHPEGLTPQQLREKLHIANREASDRSISEALESLTKTQKVISRDHKFVSA